LAFKKAALQKYTPLESPNKTAKGETEENRLEKAVQDELEASFEAYLVSMDSEIAETKVGRVIEDDEKEGPISINMNLAKNILESFSAQQGLPGPASSIITSLGARLPKRNDDESF
jgi:hypothetical protein